MNDSWTCLLVQKGPGLLSDVVCTVLKAAACDLHLKKWDEMRLTNDLVEGIIKTEWKSYTVGSRSGVLFRAQVDSEDGNDYKVNFLLNKKDLERGAEIIRQMEERTGDGWEQASFRFPLPELYQFHDLRGPSRYVH